MHGKHMPQSDGGGDVQFPVSRKKRIRGFGGTLRRRLSDLGKCEGGTAAARSSLHVENNYTDHVSRTVTPEMIATASQVIGISSRHAMALICAFPGQAEKISAMPEDIADPFGGTVDDYVRCLADIEKSLRAMFGEK